MLKKNKGKEKTISHEAIYKIMQWLPVIVAALFFLKNVSEKNTVAMTAIGICLVIFVGMLVFVRVRKLSLYIREFVLAMALPILVFMISLFSGASYSDDFSLFLAVIGLTGLYLEPLFTKAQIVLVDILLVVMYILHPEKAESQSQYILCMVVFTLAAVLFQMVIKRGRAFIEIGQERAEEAEQLLVSIRVMGVELQSDFEESSAKIESSTRGLKEGSGSIARDSGEVSDSCSVVLDKIKETEEQIVCLNQEVRQFENALVENRTNLDSMNEELTYVNEIIGESGSVFRDMEAQMKEIVGIAKQLNDISFKLTILSLNASVEAAHAGNSGSGFEVLASEMRELSESSTGFSNQVSEVVQTMQERVAKTSEKISGSEAALDQSVNTMGELVQSFDKLNAQFERLYGNIECQNENVNQIDAIFEHLNKQVEDMHNSSLENREAVESIVEAMAAYKSEVDKIVRNTQSI